MIKTLWGLTIACSGLAFIQLGLAYLENSSPKQAASALFALALAIIPYIFTRAIIKLGQVEPSIQKPDLSEEESDEIEQWLEEQVPSSSN
jgi:hypothetical protein